MPESHTEPDWCPDWPDESAVRARLARSIERLLDHDEYLLVHGHEQAITHRLAMYLQDEFPGWHVDVEYHTNLGTRKELHYNRDGSEVAEDHGVRPDIIIHQRGTTRNLLAIEAKRQGQPTGNDVEKLKAATRNEGPLEYQYGVQVEFFSGPEPARCRWFQAGEKIVS
ncbi:MAG: hypothetical protein KDB68_09825 [Planctomycetes bacterium]|nr:hypothetical protein [Planctomycetota bacterium]